MCLEKELVYFVFGLTRGSSPRRAYRSLVERIFFQSEHHLNIENLKAISIALVAHTRDIIDGKGERALFYQLMEVLTVMGDDHPIFVPLVEELLTKCVISEDKSPPYGSWKDIKYFLNHLRGVYGETQLVTKPVFEFMVKLIARQLIADSNVRSDGRITLAGKWAPREKSAFGWQAPHVAAICYPHLSPYPRCRAYRKMVSTLNRRLQTTQVLQCERRWAEIDFDKHVTSRTLFRQRDVFGRGSDIDEDRRSCQTRFMKYLSNKGTVKHDMVGVGELVREAYFNPKGVDVFWHNPLRPLGLVIPFVDTSASVAGVTKEALYAAAGIGLQLAERSVFGKRLFAFSSTSTWVNLDGVSELSDMVSRIPFEELDSNLENAIEHFLRGIMESGINPLTIRHYTIVIISDMNFNGEYNHQSLKAQFKRAGVSLPHIVYWNIGATEPRLNVDIDETNVTFISGFKSTAFNRVVHKKTGVGQTNTLWNKLVNTMCSPRYSWAWCVV